jgi:[protein-PII] uridylyltransferase
VADIRGTSPKVWNAWKGKLLEDLFRLTMRALGGDALALDAEIDARKKRRSRSSRCTRAARHRGAAVEDARPELLRAPRSERARVARTLAVAPHRDAGAGRARATRAARRGPAGAAVLARPRRPLRAHLRLLRRAGFSIQDAKIHTTHAGFALDTFQVVNAAYEGEGRRAIAT